MIYTPPPTLRRFMVDESIVRIVVGPLGSGKSMACLMELFRRACQQAPDASGVRPTRFVCVRNSAAQLRETTLADAQQYFPAARWKVSTTTLEFRVPLPDGTTVVSDWLMIPLERPEDQRKLLSLNLTGAFIEECREVEYSIVAALMGRIGRYPMLARVPPTWQGIIAASNPWSDGSEWHRHIEIDRPDGWALFRQPGGLEPDAENREHLPEDYYERLMQGHSQNWINVHVHAQNGDDESGQAVFRGVFDQSAHVTDDELRPNPQLPILIGLDFGRTGAAIIGQETVDGQLLCLEEVIGDDVGLEGFCELQLLPVLRERYNACRVFVVGDPAGVQRSQLSEESAFEVLKRLGLTAVPAPSNKIPDRIRAVERRMLDSCGKRKPALLISRDNCPELVRALAYGYRYRRNTNRELVNLPEKNSASHPADALQYLCMGARSHYVGRRIMQAQRRASMPTASRPPFGAAAWT